MNFAQTNRVSARFLAVITVFSLLASALPAPLFVAQAATTDILNEDFGTGSDSATITGWEKHEDATFVREGQGSGEDIASPNGGRFAKISADTDDNGPHDGYICREIDATDFSNLMLSYYWNGDLDTESGGRGGPDLGIVEARNNGNGDANCGAQGGWDTLQEHDLTQHHDSWNEQTAFDISDYDGTKFLIRFRNHSSSVEEWFRVDGIKITGDEEDDGEETSETIVVTGDTTTTANQPEVGWMFNRDPNNQTPFEFNTDMPGIGTGSLFVEPITNTINGNKDKFIGELFLHEEVSDVELITYDFKLAVGSETDEEHFYANAYVTLPSPNAWYDCRYNIVPTTGSTGSFTTVVFDPEESYDVTSKVPGSFVCPSSPSDLPDGSTLNFFALNVGDTSGNDTDVSGYLDNVVTVIKNGPDTHTTTYDFEPKTEEVTVVTTKVICEDEADLPNWQDGGGANITADTASDWVAQHDGCYIDPTWHFQWHEGKELHDGVGDDTFTGPKGNGWSETFTGTTTIDITNINDLSFREVLEPGYIPFTYLTEGGNTDNVTAEFNCSTGGKNYDNLEWAQNVEDGDVIQCVAFNAPEEEERLSECELGDGFADSVFEYSPGNQKDGGTLPDNRDDAGNALGAPEDNDTYNFVSLGIGGELILEFDYLIEDKAGDDFQVVETSFGSPAPASYPETAEVWVSDNGTDFEMVGTATLADDSFDLSGTSFDAVRFIKLVDTTDPDDFSSGDADGFDLDGIRVINCSDRCVATATAYLNDTPSQNNVVDTITEFIIDGVAYSDGDSFDLFVSGDADASGGSVGDDEVVIERTADGFELYFYGNGTQDVREFSGSFMLDNVDASGASISAGSEPLEPGGTWPDEIAISTTTGEVTFTLYTNTANDSFVVSGLVKDCDNEQPVCSLTLTSGGDDFVEEKGALALILDFVHPAWLQEISGSIAEWIWGDNPVADPTETEVQTFVKKFNWTGGTPTSAALKVASDNGHMVTLGTFSDGYAGSSPQTFAATQTYDVSSAIVAGENTLSIEVTNTGTPNNSDPEKNPAGLIYELEIEGVGESCGEVIEYDEWPEPGLEITSPATDYEVLSGSHVFTAEYVDADDDYDPVLWAIRAGTCNAGTNTVAGNVDQFSPPFDTPFSWDGASFSSDIDMSSWEEGDYCFVVNPTEDGGTNFRETRWFTLENPEPQQCTIVSDTGTVVVENNDYAVATWDEHNNWTHEIDGATWIWDSFYVADPEATTTRTFKETFTVGGLYDGTFEIAADNTYTVYINGTTTYQRLNANNYQTHDEYTDVADYLVEGENELIVEVTNLPQDGGIAKTNPAGALYKLEMGTEGACERTTTPEDEETEGEGGSDEDLYEIYGYVWHDEDRDTDWGDSEDDRGDGLLVTISNEDGVYATTTTDGNGFYSFLVPAGTWTITEDPGQGWEFTTDSSHEVTVPEPEPLTLLDTVMRFIIPTAHAATFGEYSGPHNFGNTETLAESGGGVSSFASSLSDSSSGPDGRVLGEQVSLVPSGAPNAGAGGAAHSSLPLALALFICALGMAVLPHRRTYAHPIAR